VQLRSITLNSTNNVDTNITGGPIALQSGGFITDNFGSANTSFFHSFPGVTDAAMPAEPFSAVPHGRTIRGPN